MTSYDTIVIGAGPAGIEAGLFLGRAQVKTMVVGIPEKSDLSYGKIIGNYFGLPDEPTGLSMLQNGVEQLKRSGVEVLRDEVVDIKQIEDGFEVMTAELKTFGAKTIVIASGAQLPSAGIRGEKDFLGKGVHTCVACDGPLFKKKKVAVVGSGAHAAEEALELAAFTEKISIYSQGSPWEIGEALTKKLTEKKIPLLEKRITEVTGAPMVKSVKFADASEEQFDGVFLAVGTAGGITFAYKLGLEQEGGFLKINKDGTTNISGVWAAGGVAGGNPQIVKSAGDGCNAAISIIRTLKGIANYVDQT